MQPNCFDEHKSGSNFEYTSPKWLCRQNTTDILFQKGCVEEKTVPTQRNVSDEGIVVTMTTLTVCYLPHIRVLASVLLLILPP
jgi:hypothetical protein